MLALAIALLSSPPTPPQEPATTHVHIEIRDEGGQVDSISALPCESTPRWAQDVSQEPAAWDEPSNDPVFLGPIPFVVPPAEDSGEPFFSHNHCPAITSCANGDLLAIWFSCDREAGLEMTILASRLRAGASAWDPASEFFKAPNRNMTGSALYRAENGELFHFNGVGRDGEKGWANLALLLRTSTDHGVTWTTPRPISSGAKYARRHQVIAGTARMPDGTLAQLCDGTPTHEGPTAAHVSRDGGASWEDAGGDIRGIHASVVGLEDGRWLALARSQPLEGRMPLSISRDQGKTWSHAPSPFPPIHGGQRLVLMRLLDGPILLVSFTWNRRTDEPEGMTFVDAAGEEFTGFGMFAALSYDEGATWPVRKLLTPGDGTFHGGAWTREFEASRDHAEPAGYLAATQTPDGVVHLISSALHYRFNRAWIEEPCAAKGTNH